MKQSSKFLPYQFYNVLLLVALLFLSNRRALVCWYVLEPGYYCEYGNALADYMLWGLVVFSGFLLLVQYGKLNEYWLTWKANWLFGLFIVYSIASLSWSVVLERSIHAIYVMLAASMTGAFLAVLYSPKQLLKTLYYFTIVAGGISLALVIIFPQIGIHQEDYLGKTWHGVFTHKNYLGSLMALGNGLSLIFIVQSMRKQDSIMNILSYFLTLSLIIGSRSATGLILWAVLNGMALLYFVWLKWHPSLQNRKLFYIAGLSGAGGILGLAILAVFLMGKRLHLTGRVPLWQNLLTYVVSQKTWFGYGLETLWYSRLFQVWAGKTSGWEIIAVNGHSGYMDMLIYLGVVGLTILCAALIQGLVRALKRVSNGHTWLDFFPLLVLVYILVTNITISYFLEFETFHWVVLVTLLFLPLGKFAKQESA
jgi:exopolysaccharide production protein ExoQ